MFKPISMQEYLICPWGLNLEDCMPLERRKHIGESEAMTVTEKNLDAP